VELIREKIGGYCDPSHWAEKEAQRDHDLAVLTKFIEGLE